MQLVDLIKEAPQHAWTGIYVRLLALVLAWGAFVHIGNIAGWTGTRWSETPYLWRVMDIVLLIFNLVVAVGLWLRLPWSIFAFVGGIVLLQLVPYTVFRERFYETPEQAQALNGLIATHLVLLGILFTLIALRK